ncbi:hypothetical protein ACFQO1_01490 [Jejudonia soesokkakensis]|uniref:Bulb-type lectin domain-containing protein n=1 Tax=Jejudonia soesokkakensis TaxID=1323432 RepID=A0ABW2MR43_9FLAO
MFNTSIQFKILSLFIFLIGFSSCNDDEVTLYNDDDDAINNTFVLDFTKTFGGSNIDNAVAILESNDGAYIILGTTESLDGDVMGKTADDADYWILKLSRTGDIIWQHTYGGTANDEASGITKTNDGGYVIAGKSRSNDGDVSGNEGFFDYWIVKIDGEGTLVWEQNFGFVGSDQAFDVTSTQDGGFIATGVLDVSASGGQGNAGRPNAAHAGGDYWAIKLNAAGDFVWSRYFGGSFTDTAHKAIETSTGDIVIIGFSDSTDVDITNNKGAYDFWIVKINASGDIIWENNYGGSEIDVAYDIIETTDNNYLIVGDTRSSDQDVSEAKGNADSWVIKISPTGDLIWQKSLGGTEFDTARSISQMQNGNYVIAGTTRSNDGDIAEGNGLNDAWIIIIDQEGDLLYNEAFGGTNLDFGNSAVHTSDNKILLVGNTESTDGDIEINKGIKDIFLVKLTQ